MTLAAFLANFPLLDICPEQAGRLVTRLPLTVLSLNNLETILNLGKSLFKSTLNPPPVGTACESPTVEWICTTHLKEQQLLTFPKREQESDCMMIWVLTWEVGDPSSNASPIPLNNI